MATQTRARTRNPSSRPKPQSTSTKSDDGSTKRLPYYCPGCGREFLAPIECRGRSDESPHQPIQTVESKERDGDESKHTPAPDTGT